MRVAFVSTTVIPMFTSGPEERAKSDIEATVTQQRLLTLLFSWSGLNAVGCSISAYNSPTTVSPLSTFQHSHNCSVSTTVLSPTTVCSVKTSAIVLFRPQQSHKCTVSCNNVTTIGLSFLSSLPKLHRLPRQQPHYLSLQNYHIYTVSSVKIPIICLTPPTMFS
jgi:hypothetical protein